MSGSLPVHEFDKRPAESLDRPRGSVVVGKAKTRGRGYAVPEMAGLAARFMEHRIDLFGEGHPGLRGGDAHRGGSAADLRRPVVVLSRAQSKPNLSRSFGARQAVFAG